MKPLTQEAGLVSTYSMYESFGSWGHNLWNAKIPTEDQLVQLHAIPRVKRSLNSRNHKEHRSNFSIT